MLQGRGVLLSTYGMVLHNADSLAGAVSDSTQDDDSNAPLWDVVILDEVRCSSPFGYCIMRCILAHARAFSQARAAHTGVLVVIWGLLALLDAFVPAATSQHLEHAAEECVLCCRGTRLKTLQLSWRSGCARSRWPWPSSSLVSCQPQVKAIPATTTYKYQ